MDRADNEVWIESFRSHAYIRIGKTDNLATLNRPEMAECAREAFQRFVDAEVATRANGNESEKEIGK
jgi:hypothetical protein